ncbi:MAG: sigma-70 family RNA polymerase sigma factor [Planctomycetota bacterium]
MSDEFPTDDASHASAPTAGVGQTEEFVRELTGAQLGLFRYISTLLGNPNDAQDVLQATNIVLWRKAGDFRPGSNFRAWSERVAYFQSRAYLRDRGRDKHVFSEPLMETLAARSVEPDDERQIALRHCLTQLPQKSRALLRERYGDGAPIKEIAARNNRGVSAIKGALLRIRRTLLGCIQRKLAEAQHA